MPLCPQITNTPITVVQNSDFDVTSVVPTVADTKDGLTSNIESIEILADGKTKVYRSASEPTGAGINDGDLWIDTDDGNKLYVRVSGAWVSAQDAAIGTAQSTANAAASAAGAAQSTANTALSNAATAYNAAIASLQPSANTIVNAQNQITAINGTGITVYSGSSATSGARVVLNSLGLAAYGSSTSFNVTNAVGNGTTVTYTASGHTFSVGQSITVSELAPSGYNGSFVITAVVAGSTFTVANTTTATLTDSNGVAERATLAISASTGNAVFSGSVTGSTIIGGTLNIGGNAIIDSSGLLTATGATITGTINATAGYFGSVSNGWSISSTGLTGVGTGAITGGTIQTSSGSTAIIMNGSSNALQFKVSGSVSGNVLPLGSAGILMHYGATPDGTGATYPKAQVTSTTALLAGSTSYSISSTSTGNNVVGAIKLLSTLEVDGSATFNNTMFAPNLSTSTSATNLRVTTGSIGEIQETSASSIRFKENIVDVNTVEEIDPKKLLNLPVRAFTYKEDYLSQNDDRFGAILPGFIAEEVDAIYPVAADYGDGQPYSWNERFIIPGLLALVQDLNNRITILEGE